MAGESEVGRKQPKLTADEVVASIRNWIDRNKGNAATRKELQQIIDTQTLRAGHQLSFTSRYVSEGHVFDVWEIGFGDDNSVPWLRIRDVLLTSRPKTQQERELWEQIRTEMAESVDRVRLGGLDASSQRSPEEQTRLGKLLDQAYQPPVAIPGTRSAADEAALGKYRPYRATRRAQVEDEIHKMLQASKLQSKPERSPDGSQTDSDASILAFGYNDDPERSIVFFFPFDINSSGDHSSNAESRTFDYSGTISSSPSKRIVLSDRISATDPTKVTCNNADYSLSDGTVFYVDKGGAITQLPFAGLPPTKEYVSDLQTYFASSRPEPTNPEGNKT
jgi:hypothetical protein